MIWLIWSNISVLDTTCLVSPQISNLNDQPSMDFNSFPELACCKETSFFYIILLYIIVILNLDWVVVWWLFGRLFDTPITVSGGCLASLCHAACFDSRLKSPQKILQIWIRCGPKSCWLLRNSRLVSLITSWTHIFINRYRILVLWSNNQKQQEEQQRHICKVGNFQDHCAHQFA